MGNNCNCCDFGFQLHYRKPEISLIVVGHSLTTTEKGYGNVTALNESGELLWTVNTGIEPDFNDDELLPVNIVIDDETNIIVRCHLAYNFNNSYAKTTIIKYRRNGTEMWRYSTDLIDSGISDDRSLAVDKNENIWFAFNTSDLKRPIVYKLNKDGDLIDTTSHLRLRTIDNSDDLPVFLGVKEIDINSRNEVMLNVISLPGGEVGPFILDADKNVIWDWPNKLDVIQNRFITKNVRFNTDDALIFTGSTLFPANQGVVLATLVSISSDTSTNISFASLPDGPIGNESGYRTYGASNGGNYVFNTTPFNVEGLDIGFGYNLFLYDGSITSRLGPWEYVLSFDSLLIDINGSTLVTVQSQQNPAPRNFFSAETAGSNQLQSFFLANGVRVPIVNWLNEGDILIFTHERGRNDTIVSGREYYVRSGFGNASQYAISETIDGPIHSVPLKLDEFGNPNIYEVKILRKFLVQRLDISSGDTVWEKSIPQDKDEIVEGKCLTVRNFS